MKFKELKLIASFAWGHFRRGYGMGTSFLLGIINALNIVILDLKVFIPSFSLITFLLIYVFGFIAIVIVSIGFDFLLLWMEFTQKEYLLGIKDSPSASTIIGSKEILNYESAIAGFNRELNNYEVQKAICEFFNLKDKIPLIEQNIESTKKYKAQYEDMLNKAVK